MIVTELELSPSSTMVQLYTLGYQYQRQNFLNKIYNFKLEFGHKVHHYNHVNVKCGSRMAASNLQVDESRNMKLNCVIDYISRW